MHYQKKVQEYLIRAEKLKELQREELARRKIVKQVHIAENSKGYSYQTLFGQYLDERIREIIIEEPFLSRPFQLFNLVQLLELLTRKCKDLKVIKVITRKDGDGEQINAFSHLKQSLQAEKAAKFIVEYSNTLHDRTIV